MDYHDLPDIDDIINSSRQPVVSILIPDKH